MLRLGLYFDPISAHESSERSINYGPSEIIHIEDYGNSKYILGKYDRWVSCNTVKRAMLFFWMAGNQPTGFENVKTKAVCYTWHASYNNYKAYGIINNANIARIEILLGNGEILTQTAFYDDLFLLTWTSEGNDDKYFETIRAYDAGNNLVYKEEY
jgi:hypothetical protein